MAAPGARANVREAYNPQKRVLLNMVWEEALESIRPDIEERGYFHWETSFQQFKAEYGIDAQQKALFYLSLDFWRLQRQELLQNNWYVIRFGRGSFGIFSSDQFPKPYLELNGDDAEEISCKPNPTYRNLRNAFARAHALVGVETNNRIVYTLLYYRRKLECLVKKIYLLRFIVLFVIEKHLTRYR